MSPPATTFSTLVPPPRSIALKPAHWLADIVTVSLPLLPVSASTLLTVPLLKATVVALVRITSCPRQRRRQWTRPMQIAVGEVEGRCRCGAVASASCARAVDDVICARSSG